mgnify:CR=1 FL=1
MNASQGGKGNLDCRGWHASDGLVTVYTQPRVSLCHRRAQPHMPWALLMLRLCLV